MDQPHLGDSNDLRALGTAQLTRTFLERVTQLVRKEVELARREVEEDVKHTKTAGGLGGGGIVAGVSALICALIAAVDGLGHVMPHWLAALILMAVFACIGVGLGWGAWKEARAAQPRRSLREAKATVRWLTRRYA
ncbi:MAG TPA: phage holin family protein [Polyangia bacterium]|jgi:hypothetical protein|nr:phage holin family protein [Polyangia bacterium]